MPHQANNKLQIRRYCSEDQSTVWELHNLALNQVGAHAGNGPWDDDLHDIKRIYIDAGGEFLVGEIDGTLVAMGAIRPISKTSAEVKRMRVNPEHQRKGFGQVMLSALEEVAKGLGFETLRLDTTTKQHAAQRLYERNGFKQVGRVEYAKFECLLYEKSIKD